MRISDWSSDVCSSDLDDLVQADGVAGGSAVAPAIQAGAVRRRELVDATRGQYRVEHGHALPVRDRDRLAHGSGHPDPREVLVAAQFGEDDRDLRIADVRAEFRSEEHTSELQSLMRISYAVFCLKKKKKQKKKVHTKPSKPHTHVKTCD